MKQRTRKLWTVLVAALFVIAVAFGLGLALVSGRENAHSTITAEAVDETTNTFTLTDEQGEQTLYSYEKIKGDASTVGQVLFYHGSSGFLDGQVPQPGASTASLYDMRAYATVHVYLDAEGKTQPLDDLRPLATEGDTYVRYFQVEVSTTEGTYLSNIVDLTITAAQPNTNPLNVDGNNVFPALTSFEESVSNLTVQVVYDVNSSNPYDAINKAITLDYTGKDEEGNPIYGGYWVEYQDDGPDPETGEPDRTDVFEFNDKYLYIYYQEPTWEDPVMFTLTIEVEEASINAPSPNNDTGVLNDGTYDGKTQSFSFRYFEKSSSTANNANYSPFLSGWTGGISEPEINSDSSTITYTGSEAGTYSVSFRASDGYRYLSVPNAAASATYRKGGVETTYTRDELDDQTGDLGTLIGVTYEWNIEKATITGATIEEANQLPDSWKYGSQPDPDEPTASEIALETSPSIENLTAASETVFAAGTSHTNFIYNGTDGTSYSSTALPSDAGEYTWAVQLTGMNNFKDYTGSTTAFEIYKQVVELPALDETSFEYDGGSHAPQLTGVPENPPYGTLSVEAQTGAGSYEATLTLTDSDNYEWADPEEDSGITVSGATATYSWSIGKAVNTIKDLTIADWTWGKYNSTANAPSASATFGGDITYTYHKTQDGEQISADTLKNLDAGTYWVKAVSTATDDYDADTEWFEFEVEKAALARPSLAQSELTYNGTAQAPVLGDDFQSDLANGYYTFTVTEQTLVNASGKTYEATVTLDENHCWADNGTDVITLTWTMVPAEITTSGELSRTGWTYGAAESTLTNTLSVTVDFATTDDVLTQTLTYYQKNGDNFEAIDGEPTDAGTYRVEVTFLYSKNANGVSNFVPTTIKSAEFTIEKDTLEFDTITEGELDWMWGQVDNLAISSFAPKATYGVSEGESVTATLTYYYANGFSVDSGVVSGTEAGSDFANLHAGSYKVYAYVEAGTNYNAGYAVYDFEVEQADPDVETEKVEYSYDITINNQTDWTYDDEADHAISVTVKVGGHTLESGEYTVYYFTRGWDENNNWGDGVELTLKDGVYRMPETYDAGEYYIGVVVTGNDNYKTDTLGYEENNAFTVKRKEISIPEGIGRQLEYTADTQQAPSELISNVADGTLNPDWEWASDVSFVGYAETGESNFGTSAPSAYGTYYLRLELKEPNNYAWVKVDDELADYSDEITGESNEYYDVVFQITGKDYGIVVKANGWTYGGTITVPTFAAATGEDYKTSLTAALEEGVTVTYFFYRLESQSNTSDGTLVDGATVTRTKADSDYALGTMPKEIAENPGYYRVVVSISESAEKSYASASAETTFTVSPYTLTNSDIVWTVPENLDYRGSAFTFDADGNGSDDIYATYQNWTYDEASGAYVDATSTSYLVLSLEGGGSILNADDYTLTAVLPVGEKNITLAEGLDSQTKEVEIKKLALTVSATLKDGTIVYGEAAPTSFDDYNIKLTGAVNADEEEALKALLQFVAKGYTAGEGVVCSNVGKYDINITFNADDVLKNYTFNGADITKETVVDTVQFEVTKRTITVNITTLESTYGEDIKELTYSIEGETFDNASDIFTLTLPDGLTDTSDAGSYRIKGVKITAEDGGRADNYVVEFVGAFDNGGSDGLYTIKPRTLTVTAGQLIGSVEYGDAAPKAMNSAGFTADPDYFDAAFGNVLEKDKETLKGLLSFSVPDDGYRPGNDVDDYTVNVLFAGGLKNYSLTDDGNGISMGAKVTTAQLKVVERKVTVTINNIETEYGTPKAFEVSYERVNGSGNAFLGDDTDGGTDSIFTLSLQDVSVEYNKLNVGTYTIVGTDVSTNYAVTFKGETGGETGTYEVIPRKIAVTLTLDTSGHDTENSLLNGGPIFDGLAWTYTATGEGENGDGTIYFPVTYKAVSGSLTGDDAVNAGTYQAFVKAGTRSNDTYQNYQAATDATETFSIAPRTVEVTWTEQTTFTYNGEDQFSSISATYQPWKDGSQLTGENDAVKLSITTQEFKNANTYTFTATLEDENYTLSGATSGTYTMQKAEITVTIKDQRSEYGEALVDFSNLTEDFYTITDGTLYDNANDVFSFEVEKATKYNVGFYDINATQSGERKHNYDVTFANEENSYEVYAREVTVALSTHTETYKNDKFNAFTATLDEDYTVDRLVSGDNLNITLTPKTDAIDVGSYAYYSVAANNTNYNVTFKNATEEVFVIQPASITVTIADQSSEYGEALAALTYSVSGELFDVSEAAIFKLEIYKQNDLSTPVSVPQGGHLDAGEYVISIVGSNGKSPYTDGNFTITFNTAKYTVTTARIGIKFEVDKDGHLAESLDGTNPIYDGKAWEYKAYGLKSDGSINTDITFKVTYYKGTVTAEENKLEGLPTDAGTYTVVVEAETSKDGNYAPSGNFTTSFTIAQRLVTVTWTKDNFTYNGDDQFSSISATYQPWVDGSQLMGDENAVKLSITTQEFKNANTYTFTATLEDENYKLSGAGDDGTVTKKYTMQKAEITVEIIKQTTYYGDPLNSLDVTDSKSLSTNLYTITYTDGSEATELHDAANLVFSLSSVVNASSDAADYDIVGAEFTGDGSRAGNYVITFVNADDSSDSNGVYTVAKRPVKITIGNFDMIYGTDFNGLSPTTKATLSSLKFELGDGVTGDVFVNEGAQVAAETAVKFAITGSYDAASAAGTTWTVTASLDDPTGTLKNYTFEEGEATMTVIARPITVTLPSIGDSLTYGTQALEDALAGWISSASAALDGWSGYGDAIVDGDSAADIYTLVVDGVSDFGAGTKVGDYTLVGQKLTTDVAKNYDVTFVNDNVGFEIVAATFEVVDPKDYVEVTYTGENFYFREDAAAGDVDAASKYLFNHALNVVTESFVLNKESITYIWSFTVDGSPVTSLTLGGTYTVSYTVKADNFTDVTGEFTVKITEAGNYWILADGTQQNSGYEFAIEWTYGDPSMNSAWTDTYESGQEEPTFTALMGENTKAVTYYKTREGEAGNYTYSEEYTQGFGYTTPAGTYYVKVTVAGTTDWDALEAHGVITVDQRTVDINWASGNISLDEMSGTGTNVTKGFDNRLMTLNTSSLPGGLTVDGDPNNEVGEVNVTISEGAGTQLSLFFTLIDPANYCWPESATVSGENRETKQIWFSVNATVNHVTFYDKDGTVDSITIEYGTTGTWWKFAESEADTIGSNELLIKADSILGGARRSEHVAFAKWSDDDPSDDIFTLATLDGADAGTYWMLVQVFPTQNGDTAYAYGVGYLKVTITQKEVTQSEIDGISFGTDADGKVYFTYNGEQQLPTATDVPDYLNVKFDVADENVIDANTYTLTATISIADDNYKFADGATTERTVTVVIDPRPVEVNWRADTFTYNGEDQLGSVYAYFIDINDAIVRLKVTSADGTFLNAGNYTFTAEFTGWTEDGIGGTALGNYTFANEADKTHEYVMNKLHVVIGLIDQDVVYTGSAASIEQNAFYVDTFTYEIADGMARYDDLLNNKLTITVGESAVNVGTYTLDLAGTVNGDGYYEFDNYLVTAHSATLTITPKTLSFDWKSFANGEFGKENGVKLDGTEFSGFVNSENYETIENFVKVTYSGTSWSNTTYTNSTEVPTEAGNYIVTVTLAAQSADGVKCNYSMQETERVYVVEKATVEVPTIASKVYNGTPQTADVTENGFKVITNEGGTDADSYDVVLQLVDSYNYQWLVDGVKIESETYTAQFVITQAGGYEFTVSIENWKFGETANAPKIGYVTTSTLPEGGRIVYLYEGKTNGGVEYESEFAPTQAGTYTVTVTLTGMKNYTDATATSTTFTIEKAEAVIDVSGMQTVFTYDGNPHTITGAKLNHNETTLTYSETSVTDAGTYQVTISADATDNYKAPENVIVTITVNKAALTIDVEISGWTYTTEEVEPQLTYTAHPESLTATVEYAAFGSSVFSEDVPTNAGNYTVRVTYAEGTNYAAAVGTATFTIEKADAKIDTDGMTKTYTYTGALQTIEDAELNHTETTLQYSNNTFTDVPVDGKLLVTIYAAETNNYKSATATVTITVNKADMTIGVTIGSWTYGETAESPVPTYSTGTMPDGGYLEYLYTGTMNGDRPYSSSAAPTEAGEYTVTVTLKGMTNYNDATVTSAEFTINRAQAVINTDNVETEYTYNGKPQTITGATLNHNETTLVYTNNTFTDVPENGELTVKITAAQTNNYEAAEKTVTVTVNKADYSFIVTVDDWTYNEEGNTPKFINTSGMPAPGDYTVTYEYAGKTNGGVEYTATNKAPTEAGTYTVKVTLSGMQNYYDVTSDEVEFTIERAPIAPEISLLIGEWTYGKTYTDEEIWQFVEGTNPEDGTWTAQYKNTNTSLVGTAVPTDAGTYELTVIVDETDNYLGGTSNTVTIVIEKASIAFEIEIIPQLSDGGAGWVYGDQPDSADVWKFAGDFVPTGTVSATYSGTNNKGEKYENTIVVPDQANDDTAGYTLTVTVAESDNYFGGTVTATFTIVRAEAEIDTRDVKTQFTYTGYQQSVSSGAVLNHSESKLKYENNTFTNAGKYEVTISADESYNYEAVSVTLTVTVGKATLTSIGVSIDDWTYGEKAKEPVVSGTVDDATVTFRYTGVTNGGKKYDSTVAPNEAGEYTVTATASGMQNYNDASATTKFVIYRAAAFINTSGVQTSFTYTGRTQSVSSGATLNHGETTLVYTDNTFTDAGSYVVIISAAETDNYNAAAVAVTVTVSKAALDLEVAIDGWTYGEEANAPVITYTGLEPSAPTIAYLYRGTTNGGEAYESSAAPTEAGEYTVTVTLTGMHNFADATAVSEKFTIGRAQAVIDTSGLQTQFTYNGEEQSVTGGAVLNHEETELVYTNNTFTDAGKYEVTISAAETNNYLAAEVTAEVTVNKATLDLEVAIDGWTYGEEANAPSVSGNAGEGELTYLYTGTTNAGAAYESEVAPTEAGEYTVTVTAAETENYQSGTASADFIVERAEADAAVTIEDWYFGDVPSAYVLTPDFLMDEVVRVLYADEEGSFSEKAPVYAGEYTVTVYYGETANYTAGEATASFTVIERPLQMSVTLEDWTYGDEPNEPVVTGAYGIALTYRYTGTANDGTAWDSDTAPVKAGSYTLTVTTVDLENYDNASCSVDFTVLRRLISAPAWDEDGLRAVTEEHNGETNAIAVIGYDGSLMTVESDTARFELTTDGGVTVTANIHGVYTIVFTLKDTANYGWTDLNEGEGLTDPVTLTWTLTEHVISILWLIILLAVLVLIALILLIVLLRKSKKCGRGNTPDGGSPVGTEETGSASSENDLAAEGEAVQGTDENGAVQGTDDGSQGSDEGPRDGSGETRLSSFAPVGLLLVLVPLGQIVTAVALGVVLVGLIIADIAVGARVHKLAKAAKAAGESAEHQPAPEVMQEEAGESTGAVGEVAYETAEPSDEAACGDAEGEVPADGSDGYAADDFGTQGEDAGTDPDGADRPEDMGGMPE